VVVSVGVVGDYRPEAASHRATNAALHHAADVEGVEVEVTWIPTTEIGSTDEPGLGSFGGLLVAPGSPYRSMEGALSAITVARTRNVPLLATCGGFQHVVLEYARNVLDVADAQHAEYDPYASEMFITPLSCSPAGRRMAVNIRSETRAAASYGCGRTTEQYYCNFGLNPDHLDALTDGGLVVSGVDDEGEARIIELPGHRFFVATLFVPQISCSAGNPHPLVASFVQAAACRPSRR
jgi:CTP synthase (UTP-ammonia lyase)